MKVPMCEHIFHINCLKKWLIDFQKCPVCESNIVRMPKDSTQEVNIAAALQNDRDKTDDKEY